MVHKGLDFRTLAARTWFKRLVFARLGLTALCRALAPHQLSRFFLRLIMGFFALSVALVLAYTVIPVALTPLMVIRAVESFMQDKPVRFEKDWLPIDKISPRLQDAVIAAEDMRFFEHNGFDWLAIEKAFKHNGRSRHLRGGSTITQQVAKNVFLWPRRSWVRKIFEAYFTALIEIFWSKRRIMEVYLNVIELGDGIYGVEAAARKYYRKSARDLTSAEAALLAAVLPNPRRFLVTRPSSYVRSRRSMIQRRMPAASHTMPSRR